MLLLLAQPRPPPPGPFELPALRQQVLVQVQALVPAKEPVLAKALQQRALVSAQARQQVQSHHHKQAQRWQASSFRHASIGRKHLSKLNL